MNNIYLGTICMEKNRWAEGRKPTYTVSDYIKRAIDDGFYGMELWQYHYTLTTDAEREKLKSANIPFIFNSYISFEERDDELFKMIADGVKGIGAKAVKYNLGLMDAQNVDVEKQVENLKRFAGFLPDNVKLLSECHGGSIMEEPEAAVEILSKLDKDRFGAMIHLQTELDFADRCYAAYGDRIWHIHCANYKGWDEGFVHINDGTDFAQKYIAYHKSKGFNGDFTIEFVNFENTPEEHYVNAVNDMNHIKTFLM